MHLPWQPYGNAHPRFAYLINHDRQQMSHPKNNEEMSVRLWAFKAAEWSSCCACVWLVLHLWSLAIAITAHICALLSTYLAF